MLIIKKTLFKLSSDINEFVYSKFDNCNICNKKIIGFTKICLTCSKNYEKEDIHCHLYGDI